MWDARALSLWNRKSKSRPANSQAGLSVPWLQVLDARALDLLNRQSKSRPANSQRGLSMPWLQVWDARALEGQAQGVLVGHTEGVVHVDAKGDGRSFISNSKDQSIKLWDLRCLRSEAQARALSRPSQMSFQWCVLGLHDKLLIDLAGCTLRMALHRLCPRAVQTMPAASGQVGRHRDCARCLQNALRMSMARNSLKSC